MTQLDAKKRARLPDSAFAYVDRRGRRRLPIHDAAHVRNALARFNQTTFDDEGSRERARVRLLGAARKHGIVPIGFITGQLRSLAVENERLLGQVEAHAGELRSLPSGTVTFLFADIEDSSGLLRLLGDDYAELLTEVRGILRSEIRREDGHEVDARADEFFAVFIRTGAALEAALAVQRTLRGRTWPKRAQVQLRMGIHRGRPTLTPAGYVGLAVHAAARICFAAHGGQILLSAAARRAIGDGELNGLAFRDLGEFRLRGLPEAEALFQPDTADLPSDFPAPRVAGA
jgi:class 3 adenylate cyclase